MAHLKRIQWIFLAALLFALNTAYAFTVPDTSGSGSGGGPSVPNTGSGSGGVYLQNPIAINSIEEFLRKALDIVVQVGFPVIVLAFVYVGFLFVKAQGKDDELKTAKTAFFWTVIGSIVVLGAWVITTALSGTIGQIRGGR